MTAQENEEDIVYGMSTWSQAGGGVPCKGELEEALKRHYVKGTRSERWKDARKDYVGVPSRVHKGYSVGARKCHVTRGRVLSIVFGPIGASGQLAVTFSALCVEFGFLKLRSSAILPEGGRGKMAELRKETSLASKQIV